MSGRNPAQPPVVLKGQRNQVKGTGYTICRYLCRLYAHCRRAPLSLAESLLTMKDINDVLLPPGGATDIS